MYSRPIFQILEKRIAEPRRFIQVMAGPRQVGKTTLARQFMETWSHAVHFASADALAAKDRQWIRQQWEIARFKLSQSESKEALLILDEAQKVPNWSEVVKSLWDEDSNNKLPLKVAIPGSSPLLVQRGLTENPGVDRYS